MEDERHTYLEDIHEYEVETVIPKAGGRVMCVKGEFKGQTGKLLERDRKRAVGVVQFDEEQNVAKLSFEQIAELA